jgi:FtsH-binding integral membrane protein
MDMCAIKVFNQSLNQSSSAATAAFSQHHTNIAAATVFVIAIITILSRFFFSPPSSWSLSLLQSLSFSLLILKIKYRLKISAKADS